MAGPTKARKRDRDDSTESQSDVQQLQDDVDQLKTAVASMVTVTQVLDTGLLALQHDVAEVRAVICGDGVEQVPRPSDQFGVLAQLSTVSADIQTIKSAISSRKDPALKRKPGDYKIAHTGRLPHTAVLETNRDYIRSFYQWVFEEAHQTTKEDCAPLRLFTIYRPSVSLLDTRTLCGTCTECGEAYRVNMNHERWILAITMNDEDLWKLVENQDNGWRLYHTSHVCKMEQGEGCWAHEHMLCELGGVSAGPRKVHQNGGICDCEPCGRPRCISPGQKYHDSPEVAAMQADLRAQLLKQQEDVANEYVKSTGSISSKPNPNYVKPAPKPDPAKRFTAYDKSRTLTMNGQPPCLRCKKDGIASSCNREDPCNHCDMNDKLCVYPLSKGIVKKRAEREGQFGPDLDL